MRVMSWVNRVLMLHGIPLLRDIPLLRRVPAIRGLTDIRKIIVDPAEIAALKQICDTKNIVFILPNHPEFFTDWMLDKDLISRCAPMTACWATNGIVNGTGNFGQKFWLWNNLIAQIPGNSSDGKAYSVEWALKGYPVLLHPEGAVGWHSNFVAPLMSGAGEMALEAKSSAPEKSAYLLPVIWKLQFTEDATSGLAKECSYIERKLKIEGSGNPAERAHHIYDVLADREAAKLGLSMSPGLALSRKLDVCETAACVQLGVYLGKDGADSDPLATIKLVKRKVRGEGKAPSDASKAASKLADRLTKIRRLGDFAFKNETITQEEVAEHLKRIRNDWCVGTLRDVMNAYLPQPVARRVAHIRILPPVEVTGTETAADLVVTVRSSLQSALDKVNDEIDKGENRTVWPNPFYSAA